MKKIFVVLAFVGIVVLGFAGKFYYDNLRGVGPAINPPSKDVTQEITKSVGPDQANAAVNNTDFPLKIPDGFTVSVFAKNLGSPRVLAWDPAGNLLVSVPAQGRVAALVDGNNDGVADGATTVISGLNKPHGLALQDGKLYIAEMDQVAVYDYDVPTTKAMNKKKIVDLPSGGNHTSRTIGFGPDKKIYISVGSSCNVCVEKDTHRGAISVANADGSDFRIFASGLRNSVFFTWHPVTHELWGTDMGRDLIGDNIPPEEVNIIKDGGFYGWPYCWGDRVHDKTFNNSDESRQRCETSIAPNITYQAHSAPLGLVFIPASFSKEYQNNLLVSYHGSWNRTVPTGYKVVRFALDDNGKYLGAEDFISGWLQGDSALGRPVDLLFDDKGVLYITDDKAGVIYRVSRM